MVPDRIDGPRRVGFVATRVSGNDGVSLEIEKWADVLESMGYTCFYIAGESDRPEERTRVFPEAHFKHPVIQAINRRCFGRERRDAEVSEQIHEMMWVIKAKLHSTLQRFGIDLIIAENCVTIPMNIPLGLAVVEVVMEHRIGCIAHHHDFVWERERFLVNAVNDYLGAAFPPAIPEFQHVVINSQAAREFSRRTGLPCRVVPNVMNFDLPPKSPDQYGSDFRQTIGLAPDDRLILQPTRVVPRKGIEHSIELIRRLDDPRCKLVITHSSGDEGDEYPQRVREYAELLGVDVILAEPWIANQRGTGPDGQKQYTIWDAYRHADLVTYPSTYEGFGNAFLEAVYYKVPILTNHYAIYRTDIEPCGFRSILMDGYLTEDVVRQVHHVLEDREYYQEIVEHNYKVAKRFFSFERLETELRAILGKPNMVSARH